MNECNGSHRYETIYDYIVCNGVYLEIYNEVHSIDNKIYLYSIKSKCHCKINYHQLPDPFTICKNIVDETNVDYNGLQHNFDIFEFKTCM